MNKPLGDIERLMLRADTSAEAHLAEVLKQTYDGTDDRFDDEEISAFRETFIAGWMNGYRAALDDYLKGELFHDGTRDNRS